MAYAIDQSGPVVYYFGAGWKRAPWVTSFLPAHDQYLEPFCGVASFLVHKPRAKVETINDIDGRVVNFLRTARDRADELIEHLRWTPYAEREYIDALDRADDPFVDAVRFWVLCNFSVNGGPNPAQRTATNPAATHGFSYLKAAPGRGQSRSEWTSFHKLERLRDFQRRLLDVEILERPALNVLDNFRDVSDLVILADPPYVQKTRKGAGAYSNELSDDDHRELADSLRQMAGLVVLCGYQSELYRELYEEHGWIRHDREYPTNSGSRAVESVWLSPRTVAELESRLDHLPIFGGAR